MGLFGCALKVTHTKIAHQFQLYSYNARYSGIQTVGLSEDIDFPAIKQFSGIFAHNVFV